MTDTFPSGPNQLGPQLNALIDAAVSQSTSRTAPEPYVAGEDAELDLLVDLAVSQSSFTPAGDSEPEDLEQPSEQSQAGHEHQLGLLIALKGLLEDGLGEDEVKALMEETMERALSSWCSPARIAEMLASGEPEQRRQAWAALTPKLLVRLGVSPAAAELAAGPIRNATAINDSVEEVDAFVYGKLGLEFGAEDGALIDSHWESVLGVREGFIREYHDQESLQECLVAALERCSLAPDASDADIQRLCEALGDELCG